MNCHILPPNQIHFIMSFTNTLPQAKAHFISLQNAVAMTENFRKNKDHILAPEFKNQNIVPFSETFNREAIERLLSEGNCAAIRIYYGMDEKMKLHAILVSVNDSNEDILPLEGAFSGAETPVIVEEGQRCPDFCPPKSPLNP